MSFLSDYREFTAGLEVPPSYHTFCSLVALAGLLGRRVWTYKGDYIRVYPNLYVVLVGPPGIGKNTAMETTEDLLHYFKLPVSAESVTREKLILDIKEQEGVLDFLPADDKYRLASPYTVFATELSEFLGAGGIGMISFLTDIYSRNFYEYRTKNKGSVYLHGPYLNLIAGTTPDCVTTYLKDDIISGGFSRRCIFVHESVRYGSTPLPKITSTMRGAWERVLARSAAIRKLRGPFTWTNEATQFFVNWYPTRFGRPDPNLVGYYETKDIQLIKVAMLVAVSESNDLVIDRPHFIAGLELLSLVEANLGRVFQGIGRNELNQATVKILDQLSNAPRENVEGYGQLHCLPLKRLKAFLFKDVQGFEFDEVLRHLVESDRLFIATKTIAGEARQFVVLKEIV